MDGVNALQGYDEYNSISQNRLVSDDVAGLSCFQLIKAQGSCIFKRSQDQQGILVGRSEIVRACHQCDLTVGKGSSSLPPNLTPVVLLQSLELLAYSFSVFLDRLTLLTVKFLSWARAVLLSWFCILLLVHRNGVIEGKPQGRMTRSCSGGCSSPFDLTSQERQDWILVFSTRNKGRKVAQDHIWTYPV